MYPDQFHYLRPTSVEETIAILKQRGSGAKVLAGGQSLLPILKLKLASVETIVDIKRVPGLRFINLESGNGAIEIGSLTTHAEIANSDLLRKRCAILPEAAALIGHPNIRNRGTIGGSLSHADPAADYTSAIIALDAELQVEGPAGQRAISAESFFTGPLTTSMATDELLLAVRVPNSDSHVRSTYQKFEFFPGDFALVNIAMVMRIKEGVTLNARLVTSAGLEKPTHLVKTEHELETKRVDQISLTRILDVAANEFKAILTGSPSETKYYTQILSVLVKRGMVEMYPHLKDGS